MHLNSIRVPGATGTTGTLEHGEITPMTAMTCCVPVAAGDVNTDSSQPEHGAREALYVSTVLTFWRTNEPDRIARDFQVNDTAYRRLDPEYYAWLRSKMHMAKLAVLAGQLTQQAFDGLRNGFNWIHEWAMAHLGEAALQDAVRTLDARNYLPPVAEIWERQPKAQTSGVGTRHNNSIAAVDAICERAIAIGWTRERLYGAPQVAPAQSQCLAACLRADESLGQITHESIEIILPSGVRQHFYNPDVDQPWIRRVR